jgi:hypothetical protein
MSLFTRRDSVRRIGEPEMLTLPPRFASTSIAGIGFVGRISNVSKLGDWARALTAEAQISPSAEMKSRIDERFMSDFHRKLRGRVEACGASLPPFRQSSDASDSKSAQ